jgi:hypothetical protein
MADRAESHRQKGANRRVALGVLVTDRHLGHDKDDKYPEPSTLFDDYGVVTDRYKLVRFYVPTAEGKSKVDSPGGGPGVEWTIQADRTRSWS